MQQNYVELYIILNYVLESPLARSFKATVTAK